MIQSLDFAHALLPNGWADDVRIDLDCTRIVAVTPGAAAETQAIGLPGLGNLHSHTFQRGMAGLAERRGPGTDTFWTWREVMYHFAVSATPDDIEAFAALAFVEMVESGFTAVGEFHYLHHDRDGRPYANPAETAERIVAAAQATGIGLTLLPVFYAHATFGGAPPTTGQRRFICDVDGFSRLWDASRRALAALPSATLGLAPHSLRAVTGDELDALLPLATDTPIHMHVAEQVKEVADCVAATGSRPVDWLLDHAAVDPRWCLIHATHMTDVEACRLAATSAVAGLCPVTEANLGDGIFPARVFTAAGGRFGVGTDSNVLIGLANELRQLEYAQRLDARERNVLAGRENASTARTLTDAALRGGAQALGQNGPIGLQPGARADIVALDGAHVSLASRRHDAVLDTFVFGKGSAAVSDVWCAGQHVVAHGRHRAREPIERRFGAALARVLA